MKFTIALIFALIAIAFAKPASEVEVIKEKNRNAGDGTYHYNVKLTDGTHYKQTGKLEDAGGETPSLIVRGLFSFVENGKEYTVRYTADATGFHAEGDHLPKSPEEPSKHSDVQPRILGAISRAI